MCFGCKTNVLYLFIAGIPQRIPSPRELQYHTQSIMQNALIRKKLEEQRENFRKRQEQENAKKNQHETSSSSIEQQSSLDQQNIVVTTTAPSQEESSIKNQADSPVKKVVSSVTSQSQRPHAPSPSIFTPTSVLRKMTAEKETDSGKPTGNNARMDEKKKQTTNIQQQQQPQHVIRNQIQQPFMNNMAPVERMKIQNDGFGMNTWDSPHQLIQGGMKPPGNY